MTNEDLINTVAYLNEGYKKRIITPAIYDLLVATLTKELYNVK